MLSLAYEKKLARKGFCLVAGVDEVGRGPLAGPLVAAAVILPLNCTIKGIDDSKKLTPQKREQLSPQIKKQAHAIGVARISHQLIDRLGVGRANLLAMKKAVESLSSTPDYLLIDGKRNKIDSFLRQEGIHKGDQKCASIAAASIIAKVVRDRIMRRYHQKYPHYGFDQHKGYGTRRHQEALRKYGPCAIHRRSFLKWLGNNCCLDDSGSHLLECL
jgi:ribonuclease HII